MASIDWAKVFLPTTPFLEIVVRGSVVYLTIFYALDWLAYRSAWCRRILRPPAVQIIRDGRLLRRSPEQEKISEDELMGELRAHGCDDVARVRAAYIESDGMISVVTRRGGVNGPRRKSGI